MEGDDGPGVVSAHRASVGAAIDYLEEHALVVRDRRGGEVRDEAGRWTGIVSFTHGVNRHGEPHLHDHVLVGALPEGSRTVLDSRGLFAHLDAADALYRASLRHELGERTSRSAWRSFEGVEHVVELDEGYRALWGGHHADRGAKLQWQRHDAIERWRTDRSRFIAMGVVEAPERHATLDEHAFAGSFEGRYGVARRHLVAAWSNAARFGQHPAAVTRAIDSLYPELTGSRGVREPSISVRAARMTEHVRQRGSRPLETPDLERWRQRSRDDPRSRSERSR
jgi:hypothetical protein